MNNRNKGFSLVELLVAMGLIGIVLVAVINYGSTESKLQKNASNNIAVQMEVEKLMNLIVDTIQEGESLESTSPDISDENYHSVTQIKINAIGSTRYKTIDLNGTEAFYKVETTGGNTSEVKYSTNIDDIQIKKIKIGSETVGLGIKLTGKLDPEEISLENNAFFRKNIGLNGDIESPPEDFYEVEGDDVGFDEDELDGYDEIDELLDTFDYETDDWEFTVNEDTGEKALANTKKNQMFLFNTETYDGEFHDYEVRAQIQIVDPDPDDDNWWSFFFETYPNRRTNGTIKKNQLKGRAMTMRFRPNDVDFEFRLEEKDSLTDEDEIAKVQDGENNELDNAIDEDWFEEVHEYVVRVEAKPGDGTGYKKLITVMMDDLVIFDKYEITVDDKDEDPMVGISMQEPIVEIMNIEVTKLN